MGMVYRNYGYGHRIAPRCRPQMRSRCLDNYALAYLFIAPVEISLITFAPVAFLNGYGLVFTGICLAAGLAVLATAYIKGWFIRKQ